MKVIERSTYVVEYDELDRAVTEFLKSKGPSDKSPDAFDYLRGMGTYSCVECEEWGNDSYHDFTVEAKDAHKELEGRHVSLLKYRLYVILNWMCAEGEIKPGEYSVNVCW